MRLIEAKCDRCGIHDIVTVLNDDSTVCERCE
jgi:hypothetical protein